MQAAAQAVPAAGERRRRCSGTNSSPSAWPWPRVRTTAHNARRRPGPGERYELNHTAKSRKHHSPSRSSSAFDEESGGRCPACLADPGPPLLWVEPAAICPRFPVPSLAFADLGGGGEMVDSSALDWLVNCALEKEAEEEERKRAENQEPRLWGRSRKGKKRRKKRTPPTSTRGRARRRHRQSHVLGWYSGFSASHAVYPSFVGRPERPGIMVGKDEKDSYAVTALVFDCTSYAGFAGIFLLTLGSLSVAVRPKMLGIMAGMNQKDVTWRDVLTLFLTCPSCATTGAAGYRVQKTVGFSAVAALWQGRRHSWRDAEADFRGPDCSADQWRDSPVALGQGGRCPCCAGRASSTGAGCDDDSRDRTVASR